MITPRYAVRCGRRPSMNLPFPVSVFRTWWQSTTVVLLLAAAAVAAAAPVGDALERPAIMSTHAAHSVLLGAAQAGSRLVAVGERGIVVISEDSGASWRHVQTPVSVTLNAVRFADEKHGYAVGHGGTVLVSADGGETWTRCLDGRLAAQLALAAAQTSGDAADLREAERLVAEGPDKPLFDVLVLDPQHAVVVGAYGLAFATDDGGQTWTSWMDRLDNPKGLHLYTIRSRGETIVVAGEQGLVRRSSDAGLHFAVLTTPYRGSYFTAELPTAGGIVVAGLRGNFWRSRDAGASWTQLASPMQASITASAIQSDGALVLVNQAGVVMRAGALELEPISATPLPSLNGVLTTRDGGLFALSSQGVFLVKPGDVK